MNTSKQGMLYAGVGSRETPADVLRLMTEYAGVKARQGAVLRSGGALGADSAFEDGVDLVGGVSEIYTPDDVVGKHRRAYEVAEECHPNWGALSHYVRKLMVRNVFIVGGPDCRHVVDYVLCWTPRGCVVGGTGHTIRVAGILGAPVYNLHDAQVFAKAKEFILKNSKV